MSFDRERLYELLPAWCRVRDAEQGGPLKALLTVIAEQVAALEEDLAQLYDDQFIETCAEWVVPYIGDLVGASGLFVFPDADFSQRAQVANTLAYRRRKGTAAVLEQLARDVTGWDANVVEYFQLLAATQYMNHLRPDNLSFASLRERAFGGLAAPISDVVDADRQQLERMMLMNTPFGKTSHTVDVRRIEPRRGRYNIPNVGIFLWRIGSYSLTLSPAFKVDGRRYRFDALGKDIPLYNRPQAEDQIIHLAEPANVPMPISRMMFDKSLETFYGAGRSILLTVDGNDIVPDQPEEQLSDLIRACDLSDIKDAGGNVTSWAHMPLDRIAIDPVLGRIAFPSNQPPPREVKVTYHYGFSAEMGGGEYGRAKGFDAALGPIICVTKTPTTSSDETTIQDALNLLTSSSGAVEVKNNDLYSESPIISAAPEKKIELRAADKLRSVLEVGSELVAFGGDNAEIVINGLLISGGRVLVPAHHNNVKNQLHIVRLRHCTLVPEASPAISALLAACLGTLVEIDRCIVIGGIRAIDGARVRITDSIIDAGSPEAVAYAGLSDDHAGGALEIENSTLIGKVHTTLMQSASNTVFHAALGSMDSWTSPANADRLQQGCVRFSYTPLGSRLPRRYRCLPEKNETISPIFTSLRYGDPGYCQLSMKCPVEMRTGADDGAEIGAFHSLCQPQREANLRARLDEYLRFGLEAGILYAS